jgi:hypothetical protein
MGYRLGVSLKKDAAEDVSVVKCGGQGQQAELNQVPHGGPRRRSSGLVKLLWRAWAMHELVSPIPSFDAIDQKIDCQNTYIERA